MIQLKTLFKNHFDNPEISDDELQKFSEDHLARLSAAHDPRLAEILADTGTAHLQFYGSISNEDVAAAVRQGMTVQVDNTIQEFKKLVQRKEGAVRSAFGQESAEYQDFFPHGLTEYTHATKETIERLMERLVTVANIHKGSLEPELVKDLALLRDKYKPQREAQLGKKGEVAGHKSSAAGARTELEWQLMANIHFIGYQFRSDVQQALSFFDQSFLRDHRTAEDGTDDEQPEGKG